MWKNLVEKIFGGDGLGVKVLGKLMPDSCSTQETTSKDDFSDSLEGVA